MLQDIVGAIALFGIPAIVLICAHGAGF